MTVSGHILVQLLGHSTQRSVQLSVKFTEIDYITVTSNAVADIIQGRQPGNFTLQITIIIAHILVLLNTVVLNV